jgi:hypothetical protein
MVVVQLRLFQHSIHWQKGTLLFVLSHCLELLELQVFAHLAMLVVGSRRMVLLVDVVFHAGLYHTISETEVVLVLLLEAFHVFLVIIKDIPPAIARIECLHVKVMWVDGFLLFQLVQFEVQRFALVLELVEFDHVVEKHSHQLVFLFGKGVLGGLLGFLFQRLPEFFVLPLVPCEPDRRESWFHEADVLALIVIVLTDVSALLLWRYWVGIVLLLWFGRSSFIVDPFEAFSSVEKCLFQPFIVKVLLDRWVLFFL